MYKTESIRIEVNDGAFIIKEKIAKKCRLRTKDIVKYRYAKRSLDARNKSDIFYVCSFYVWLEEGVKITSSLLQAVNEEEVYATLPIQQITLPKRPVIIGFGPCGMFIGLYLAKLGCKPIIYERGRAVEERIKDIMHFQKTHELNVKSNIQFGEGGAGTFSDGKLTTSKTDKKTSIILNEFVAHGAPSSILYENKPHIGTDYLVEVVQQVRNQIIQLGGEVHFEHQFIDFHANNGKILAVTIQNQSQQFERECDDVFLAIGHSARDTFSLLYNRGIEMSAKSFAVGVRIEHLQSEINQSQWGDFSSILQSKAADYKLVNLLSNGRTAYTFCMCPGGYVVNAASEEKAVCSNGMSRYDRSGVNANSAVLVTVTPSDFSSDHPLAGVEFQRQIEQAAFHPDYPYALPVQTVGSFLKRGPNEYNRVYPSWFGGHYLTDLSNILPDFVTQSLQEALPLFEKKLRGFSADDSLLVGVETRTSSPVRILRNHQYASISLQGFYPCGEGAGYAGGIMTSALDGLKCVESVLKNVYNIDL